MFVRRRGSRRARRLFVEHLESRRVLSHVTQPPAIDSQPVERPIMVDAEAEHDPSQAAIPVLVAEAMNRWKVAGISSEQVDNLRLANVFVADLPGSTLGLVSSSSIVIDSDAAGVGWFIDSTPHDDSEFSAAGGNMAAEGIDLLTVLIHEMGHLIGMGHSDAGVMAAAIPPATRLVPQPIDQPVLDGEGESAPASTSEGIVIALPNVSAPAPKVDAPPTVIKSAAVEAQDNRSAVPVMPRPANLAVNASLAVSASGDGGGDLRSSGTVRQTRRLPVLFPEREHNQPARRTEGSAIFGTAANRSVVTLHSMISGVDREQHGADDVVRRTLARQHDAALLEVSRELDELPFACMLAIAISIGLIRWDDSAEGSRVEGRGLRAGRVWRSTATGGSRAAG